MVILITGITSGFGKAMAEQLHADVALFFIVDNMDSI